MAKKKVFSIGSALSQGLEETIESARNYSGELRIDVIPIKKIELDPNNPRDLVLTITDIVEGIDQKDPALVRKQNELISLQSMATSIKTQGVINPILVYKHGEKYRLIAGERRTLASLLAKKIDIQAKILDEKPDELKVSLLQWIENIERSDLSLGERLVNLEKMIQAYSKVRAPRQQMTVTELSELIGCVKSHAMNYKALFNADPELKQLIRQNKIKSLEKAALIAEAPLSSKPALIEACLRGVSLKQLKYLKAELEKKPTIKNETRGRQTKAVHFGQTKNMKVAKAIINSLLAHAETEPLLKKQSIDWNDARSVSAIFKDLLHSLEKIYA